MCEQGSLRGHYCHLSSCYLFYNVDLLEICDRLRTDNKRHALYGGAYSTSTEEKYFDRVVRSLVYATCVARASYISLSVSASRWMLFHPLEHSMLQPYSLDHFDAFSFVSALRCFFIR